MATRRLKVDIVGDASSLERAFGQAGKTSSKFAAALKGGAIAGVTALGIAAKLGWDELADGERVAAQTAAVLKSTGAAANVTAKQVADLAQSISNYSGIDDEAVQAGENLLLTFTNIRNRVGAGNDVFNQATVAVADLSTAMGTDMSQAAVQVGKALNDPIRGLTALQRVGVTFTAGQKEQIRALVESGNTMAAQKVILGELTKEFGGSARAAGETLPGQMAKLRNAFESTAASVLSRVIPAISGFVDWVKRNQTAVLALATGVGVLVVGFGALKAARAAAAAVAALNVTLAANPIGIVVIAVAALAAGLVVAWRKSETFRNVVRTAFNVVKTVAGAVSGAIEKIISVVSDLAGSKPLKTLGAVLAAPFKFAIGAIRDVAAAIERVIDLANTAVNAIKRAFGGGTDPGKTDVVNPYQRSGQSGGQPYKKIGSRVKAMTQSPALRVALAGLAPGPGSAALAAALRAQEGQAAAELAAALKAQAGSGALRAEAAKKGTSSERRRQLLDAIAAREQRSIEAAQALQGIREQILSIEQENARIALEAAAAQEQNRRDAFEAAISLAKLTADTQDDLIAARNKEQELVTELAAAQAEGNNALIAQIADALFGVRQDIQNLLQPATGGTGQDVSPVTLNVFASAAMEDPRVFAAAISWELRSLAVA